MSLLKHYRGAQIYLTRCTHPDFRHLAYVGLDTKKDPNYLGSSVTLKWWISYLGREFFEKEILETVSGNMMDLCKVEQSHIDRLDAVKNPNFFNMNGAKSFNVEDYVINFDCVIRSQSLHSSAYLDELVEKVINQQPTTVSTRAAIRNALCCMLYGYLKYEQVEYEYSRGRKYPFCKDTNTFEDILGKLSNQTIANGGHVSVTICEDFLNNIPKGLNHNQFTVVTI